MDAKELVGQIRADVHTVTKAGMDSIPTAGLEAYLAAIESTLPAMATAKDHALQVSLAEYSAKTTAQVEGFRAVITAGQGALRSAVLINGGAAVALLSFLGTGWSREVPRAILAAIPLAMSYFVFGVLAAAMAGGGTYLSQEMFGSGQKTPGIVTKGVAIALGIGSYLLFALGALSAYIAFVGA